MSVISKLKEAIQKSDWALVDEVLQDLFLLMNQR